MNDSQQPKSVKQLLFTLLGVTGLLVLSYFITQISFLLLNPKASIETETCTFENGPCFNSSRYITNLSTYFSSATSQPGLKIVTNKNTTTDFTSTGARIVLNAKNDLSISPGLAYISWNTPIEREDNLTYSVSIKKPEITGQGTAKVGIRYLEGDSTATFLWTLTKEGSSNLTLSATTPATATQFIESKVDFATGIDMMVQKEQTVLHFYFRELGAKTGWTYIGNAKMTGMQNGELRSIAQQSGTTEKTSKVTVLFTKLNILYTEKPEYNANNTRVGAIYWAGSYSGDRFNPDEQVNSTVAYRHRLPYFSTEHTDGSASVHEDNQHIVDQEINLAADAGLDYFAFVYYSNSISKAVNNADGAYLNYGVEKYITSPVRDRLAFSLISVVEGIDPNELSTTYLAEIKKYLINPLFLTDTSGKNPIIFMFTPYTVWSKNYSDTEIKNGLASFKNAIKTAIGKTPIIVSMNDPLSASKKVGFDAVSAYNASNAIGKIRNGSYASLITDNNNLNSQLQNSSLPFIPVMNIGWDPRPRLQAPGYYLQYGQNYSWYAPATAEQITSQLNQTITVAKRSQKLNAVILYAWNEYAEGGWLVPSKTDGNMKLNAIAKSLDGIKMNTPKVTTSDASTNPHSKKAVTITNIGSNKTLERSAGAVTIKGTAARAARITLTLGTVSQTFVNGLGTPHLPSANFAITLENVPAGMYTLSVTGDVVPLTLEKVNVR